MVLTDSDMGSLEVGAAAPNFSLPATDGKTYSLSDFTDAKAMLIVFMCNHCPYVKPKIKELNRITSTYKDKGLVVVGINSNDEEFVPDDSFEKMKEFAAEKDIQFIYLRDESQEIAKAYGATCTPDPFLFDGGKKLIFHSRLDDKHGEEQANNYEMFQAIGEFLESGKISLQEHASQGCNIKWKSQ